MPCAKASMPPSVSRALGVGKSGLLSCRIDFLQAPRTRVEARIGSKIRFSVRWLYSLLFILRNALVDQLEPDIQRELIGPEVRRAVIVSAGEGPDSQA